MPEYHFTNQLGRVVSTSQFKGQALSFTFMFTRCPLPNFCPLMSANFGEAQDKLLALPNAPTNWHLLTISFDPEFDNSAVLKLYSARFHPDPARWDFASGDLTEIQTLADQCGLLVERDPASGGFNHNLRTVVIDAAGRVQKIFIGNEWKSDELVAEMVKAAGNK
jgi:protein SCO1/2